MRWLPRARRFERTLIDHIYTLRREHDDAEALRVRILEALADAVRDRPASPLGQDVQ
jgi:hypothetical protein